ncbi:MAG: 23S rRNA (uracil(1939)-C(5))-methyltransferase RlmD [Calditrichaeota bacterium]|nr:MAG: 23S rRNA (uracil(1939)-C(5))-methyltransferase RlmD [Calditrichota bacterium]
MPKLKKRQQVELKIEKVAFGGKGIAFLDDFVIFVERTVPGDVVQARIKKIKKSFAEAYPVEFIQRSPLRGKAPCVHFEHCGGCRWQDIDYEEQLRFKRAHVLEVLKHIAGIKETTVEDILPAPQIFGYRNKMEFSFAEKGWLTPEELQNEHIQKTFALGLHVPGYFDKVVNIEYCHLQSEEMNAVLNFSREFFSASGIPVYHPRTHQGILRFLVLRQSFSTGKIMVILVTATDLSEELSEYVEQLQKKFPLVASVYNGINSRPAQIAAAETYLLLYGEPVLYEKIGQFQFEISPDSFFQTNTLQAKNLYELIHQYAGVQDDIVWDLYSGTGSIAIYLAEQARKVIGFEIVEKAVEDARRNADVNGISNCEFVAGDVRHLVGDYKHVPPRVLICDPPRSGMHKDVVKTILEIAPQRIIYVSCNPATMARDIALLAGAYNVRKVHPVDMFPHTYHIESVVQLERQ